MRPHRLGLSSFTIEPGLSGDALDGIGVYTKKLLEQLSQRQELDVIPYAYSRFGRRRPHSIYPKGKVWQASFSTSALFSLLTKRSLLRAEIDIFHATDYRIPKLSCPVVATLHDAVPLQYPHWVNLRWRNVKNYIMRSSIKWANHIIALSHAVVPDIIEYYKIKECNISVVHSGVDATWLLPLEAEVLDGVRKRYQLPSNYFLFVGTLQPRKNILRILQAYQALPAYLRRDYKLVIVGKTGWNVEQALALLQQLVQSGDVIWLSQVRQEQELRAIYQMASVFVFPSLYEGFGLPVLEAYASGVPVITSNVSALPEVAGDAAVFVNPYDSAAIAQALQTLCEDTQHQKTCITKGLVRAREKSWELCAKQTLEVYQKLL